MSKRATKLGDGLAIVILGVVLAGLVLRFTLRDSWQPLAPAFYALPLPVIAVAMFVVAAWWQWRHRKRKSPAARARRAVMGCCAGGVLVFGLWWAITWGNGDREKTDYHDVTIAFWNAAGREDPHPMDHLVEWLRDSQVDVLALAEVSDLSAEVRRQYGEALPGYEVHRLGKGMALFCRGEAVELQRIQMANSSSAHLLRCRLKDESRASGDLDLHVVVADIGSNPLYPRGDLLDDIFQLAGGEAGAAAEGAGRMVVVGDFNTPYESAFFDPYRQRFLHAWSESGDGYRETWPWFAPLLCIDHIWLSRELVPLATERKNFFQSDHSLIVTRVAVVTPAH